MDASSCTAEKVCTKCRLLKPASQFHRNRQLVSGLCSQCKSCRKEAYKSNPHWHENQTRNRTADQKRDALLKTRYGISLQEYKEMANEQNGLCKICGRKPSNDKGLCVDHCHQTSHVRGLLCPSCNTLLGMAKDNPDILQSSLNYLLGE